MARREGALDPPAVPFLRACLVGTLQVGMNEAERRSVFAASKGLFEFAQNRTSGKPHVSFELAGGDRDRRRQRGILQICVEDMPYLVDSVTAVVSGFGLEVAELVHPVVAITRDADGRMIEVGASRNAVTESMMHVELSGDLAVDRLVAIRARLHTVLDDVRAVFEDTPKMQSFAADISRARLAEHAETEREVSPGDETAAFIDWLAQEAFIFLGSRAYEIGEDELNVVTGSGCGLLRDETQRVFGRTGSPRQIAADTRAFLDSSRPAMVSKSNHQSSVHRAVLLDAVLVKRNGADGRPRGLDLLLGLFTPAFHHAAPSTVPVLREKLRSCEERLGFARGGYDWTVLQRTLSQLPRDILLQVDGERLIETVFSILRLDRRPRTALFTLHDPCSRFATCLVYLDRDRFSAEVRARMASILEQAFAARAVSDVTNMEHARLTRIDFILALEGRMPALDLDDLERRLVEASRAWRDRLSEAVAAEAAMSADVLAVYGSAFPSSYSERHSGAEAVADIEMSESLGDDRPIAFALREGSSSWRLKLYRMSMLVALSDVLPMLENAGWRVIKETAFEVRPAAKATLFIQEFELEAAAGAHAPHIAERMEDLLEAAWTGVVEDDQLNELVLSTRLRALQIVVLRVYAKLLKQLSAGFGESQIAGALNAHPILAERLFDYFETLLDPHTDAAGRVQRAASLARNVGDALDAIESATEDRILRAIFRLIEGTLRTSFYQGAESRLPAGCVSIKLASQSIDLLPQPRPLVEIFVYSPRVEGCHLRGDLISRGGLRWSNRHDDFRTEVLGLMKAQMVKNAVIVPRGSKGGFIVKRSPAQPEQQRAEVEACYATFITGLLTITDTIANDAIVPPRDVVRRDGDDPYLVVAADKGTATFSDLANEVAGAFGFWLGDAFASGGTVGFDHKRMGITAKGAWEAVKRHFLEMGVDIQVEPFTCVGVGDMSGDVFGNGMLLSRQTRLVAAFDHRHIFIDPSPDCDRSWMERKRLFDMTRSSWADYDRAALSPGGQIYQRDAKVVRVSPEARACLGLAADVLPPAEIIKAILRADVDLIWFGGIGTYVKASTEATLAVGDRANDGVRVSATELRAKVIGEGANLAITQRARIEYALAGGRINTDAIDNSAGVDTSDHEVNIKIALGDAIRLGRLPAVDRTAKLRSLIGDVEQLVLASNRSQTFALTVAELNAAGDLDRQMDMVQVLERDAVLDRSMECLPDENEVAGRRSAGQGLVRPELAILTAYAKTMLRAELLTTDVPGTDALLPVLFAYFPAGLVAVARDHLASHRLRREIVATRLANMIVDRMGPLFAWRMRRGTARDAGAIVESFLIIDDLFALPRIWETVQTTAGLDVMARAKVAKSLSTVAETAVGWLLDSSLDLQDAPERLSNALKIVRAQSSQLFPERERQEMEKNVATYVSLGAPDALASEIASLEAFTTVMDAVDISKRTGLPIAKAVERYLNAGARSGLLMLRRKAGEMPVKSEWQRLAVSELVQDSYVQQRRIVMRSPFHDTDAARPSLDHLLAEVERTEPPDLAMLTVVAGRIRTLMS